MARRSETCICRYKHCLHGENRTLLKTDAVKVGGRYFHQDCYEDKKTIDELVDYYRKEINSDAVYTDLMRSINNLVYPEDKEGISPERLLFQVKYYCTHGHMIQYPGGLHYAVQDREAFKAYEKYKDKQRISNYDFSVNEENTTFNNPQKVVRIQKQKNFEDILGG